MTLYEFLLNIRVGSSELIISSANDKEFGLKNIAEGKYFLVDGIAYRKSEKELKEYFLEFPRAFQSDWLYRDIIEINGVADVLAYRKYFVEGSGESPSTYINILVEGKESDEYIWEDREYLNKRILTTAEMLPEDEN